ncbi:MAG: zinc-dependent metalloprotease [Marinifilaceae bacterium]|jgi:hypothetical protein|nr:zinc-dependent metalloprotease [Marinifilaceae bacterium]
MNKYIYIGLIVSIFLGISQDANSQFWKSKKNKTKSAVPAPPKVNKSEEYDKLIKDADVKKGMFNIILKQNKVYLEIPKSLFKYDFLLSSRVAKTSNNQKTCGAGRMPFDPMLIKFTADTTNLYVHRPIIERRCDKDSPIYEAFKRNNINPIRFAYKIKAVNKDSSAVVIDATDLLLGSTVKEILPFEPFRAPMTVDKKRSRFLETKAFESNVQINSLLTFGNGQGSVTAEVSRNFVKLPENVMNMRYADDRFGYFISGYQSFDAEGVKEKQFLHRWRLEPKKEDIEKYNKGELVEPIKPIVWYVDSQIPEQWRDYIKKGIEDWQLAFEEIGFKNAIIARDYPSKEEDPNFDPDNFKYTCYRYVPTEVQNSMGPSHVDPRSGEILTADVIFYSNVIKLLQEWRFIQTAQIDEKVRTKKMNNKLIGESLRNVAAHEVGHTLGLMHNFVSSYQYPVDSLRSATFTKEYGTTPSIMDYARYNYVAQPEDKGVYLTPPKIGIYDKFQIKLAYKYVSKANSPEEDFKEVKKWLFQKKDEMIYTYVFPYPKQNEAPFTNPANNTESLGDDLVKANNYGIKNLKYINNHLTDWLLEDGDDYQTLKYYHIAIGKQFSMYLAHIFALVGGEYRIPTYVGYDLDCRQFVPRKKQKQALNFILNQTKEFSNWWNTKAIEKHLGKNSDAYDLQAMIFSALFNKFTANFLISQESMSVEDVYTFGEYQNDIFNNVWSNSLKNRKLSFVDRAFQSMYVEKLIQSLEGENQDRPIANPLLFKLNLTESQSLAMKSFLSAPVTKAIDYPILGSLSHRTLKLLKNLKSSSTGKDKNHYESLYYKLNKIIND